MRLCPAKLPISSLSIHECERWSRVSLFFLVGFIFDDVVDSEILPVCTAHWAEVLAKEVLVALTFTGLLLGFTVLAIKAAEDQFENVPTFGTLCDLARLAFRFIFTMGQSTFQSRSCSAHVAGVFASNVWHLLPRCFDPKSNNSF